MKDSNAPLRAHLSMFIAEAIWGFMAPIGKAAMNSGFDGISVVSFRVAGAALLFFALEIIERTDGLPITIGKEPARSTEKRVYTIGETLYING